MSAPKHFAGRLAVAGARRAVSLGAVASSALDQRVVEDRLLVVFTRVVVVERRIA